jgi:integrase
MLDPLRSYQVPARPKVIDLSPPGHAPQSFVILMRERRDGRNPQYYARRTIPPRLRKTPRNPYVTKALGQVSLERAKELAWRWWTNGETQGRKDISEQRFAAVAGSYLIDLKEKRTISADQTRNFAVNPKKYARHEQSIRLHLNPFFGSMVIREIQPEEVERWLEWRLLPHTPDETSEGRAETATGPRAYSPPARSTVQKDAVAFAAVLRHARLQFKVDTRFVPELPLPSRTRDTRRPRFYPDEWKRLSQVLYERMVASKGKRGPLSQNSIWYRGMLYSFVMILHGTGLRVAEAMHLQVKHLQRVPENAARLEEYRREMELKALASRSEEFRQHRQRITENITAAAYDYRVLVTSANKIKHYTHQRAVVPILDMTALFDEHLTVLAVNFIDDFAGGDIRTRLERLSADAWLFCHQNGRRIKSFDHGFDEVLEETGLLYRDGKRRSLTSIRHTYASERIESRAADLKAIADNMGTTVDMLNKHYAQEIRELRAADLQV